MPPFAFFSSLLLKILFCFKYCQVCVVVNQPNFQARLAADRRLGNFQSDDEGTHSVY